MEAIIGSIFVCQEVLKEEHAASIIRIIDILTLPQADKFARFFTYTHLHSATLLDLAKHQLTVKLVKFPVGPTVAEMAAHDFTFSYKISLAAPGAYSMTTAFNLDLQPLGALGTYYAQAWVDGRLVTQTPITLRRVH